MARKTPHIIPMNVNEKAFRRAHAKIAKYRTRQFEEAQARSRLVNKLKKEYLPRSGRRTNPAVYAKEIAEARSIVRQLRRKRPVLPDQPIVPIGVISAPFDDVIQAAAERGAIEYQPIDSAPNKASGQLGCTLGAWGAGNAGVQSDVLKYYYLPKSGSYGVIVSAQVNGIYYLSAPALQSASLSLTLEAWADDYLLAPKYVVKGYTTIESLATPFFSDYRDWNFINGQYLATVTFVAGDAPTYYAIGAGLTSEVQASPGCVASVEASVVVQSIAVVQLG